MFTDDGICITDSADKYVGARQVLFADLGKAGLVLNSEKPHLEPQQVGEWLGFIVNLDTGMFVVSVQYD